MARLSDEIATPRLILRLIPRAALEACMAGDAAAAARALGVAVPAELAAPGSSLHYTLAELARDPGYAPWGTRAIIRRDAAALVGTIRFHARPDPARPHPFGGHAAEFGYTILESHRRRGYASEAVVAMMGWARERGVDRFVLSIAPDNAPSLALAARLGFTRVGQQMDEIDGPEDVFLLAPPS